MARAEAELRHEETLKKVEQHLICALEAAKIGGVTNQEVQETLTLLMEGE